jgi:polyketide synthase 5
LCTGESENGYYDRVLGERLLTIEWQQRQLPELSDADAGSWLLISTTATADVVATTLTDALKNQGAHCATMRWPQHADHTSIAEQHGNHLRAGGFTGVVMRRSIDPDRPLSEYGVDSLGALELRTRIESETGIRLTSRDIATTTIRDLAGLLCEKLAPAEAS